MRCKGVDKKTVKCQYDLTKAHALHTAKDALIMRYEAKLFAEGRVGHS